MAQQSLEVGKQDKTEDAQTRSLLCLAQRNTLRHLRRLTALTERVFSVLIAEETRRTAAILEGRPARGAQAGRRKRLSAVSMYRIYIYVHVCKRAIYMCDDRTGMILPRVRSGTELWQVVHCFVHYLSAIAK